MTTINIASIALAGAITLAAAAPADAQYVVTSRMEYMCTYTSFCVWDHYGHILGVVNSPENVYRQIGNNLYDMGYDGDGLIIDATLYYLSADCSGPALMAAGYIDKDGKTPINNPQPEWAQWDGANIWAPTGSAKTVSPQSKICYGTCGGDPSNKCTPYGADINPYQAAFAPAAVIETPTFTTDPACLAAHNCAVVL